MVSLEKQHRICRYLKREPKNHRHICLRKTDMSRENYRKFEKKINTKSIQRKAFSVYRLVNPIVLYFLVGELKKDAQKHILRKKIHPLHADLHLRVWVQWKLGKRGIKLGKSQISNYVKCLSMHKFFANMFEFTKKFHDGCYRTVVNVKRTAHRYLVWLLSQMRMCGYEKTENKKNYLTVNEFYKVIQSAQPPDKTAPPQEKTPITTNENEQQTEWNAERISSAINEFEAAGDRWNAICANLKTVKFETEYFECY